MKIVGKIFALPFIVVLTVLGAVMTFLFCVASWLLTVGAVILALLAIAMFITGMPIFNCIVVLVVAFLVSPFGLQAIADWLIGTVKGINNSLKCFLAS